MKSQQAKPEAGNKGSRPYAQMAVGQYPVLGDALAACDEANRKLHSRHYVMNDTGKEYYSDCWID
jgi:hypothetical protein